MPQRNTAIAAEEYEPDLDAAANAAEETADSVKLSPANSGERQPRTPLRRPSVNTAAQMRAPLGRQGAAVASSASNQDAPREKVASAGKAVLNVGPGLNLEGKIDNCEELHVEGTASLQAVTESLVISRSGRLSGEIEAKDADIEGDFDGTIAVSGTLVIRSTGVVNGEITYGKLKIDEGGKVIGQINMAVAEEVGHNRRLSKAVAAN